MTPEADGNTDRPRRSSPPGDRPGDPEKGCEPEGPKPFGWPLLWGFVIGGFIVHAALVALWMFMISGYGAGTEGPGGRELFFSGATLTFPVAVLSGLLCGVVGRRARHHGRWTLLAAAVTGLLIGGLFWALKGFMAEGFSEVTRAAQEFIRENAFFLTKRTWNHLSSSFGWSALFLLPVLVATAAVDVVLLPFLPLFSAAVWWKFFLLTLRALVPMAAGFLPSLGAAEYLLPRLSGVQKPPPQQD